MSKPSTTKGVRKVKKKLVKVKAWYVDLPLRKFRQFSGEGWKFRARIFPTKKLAIAAFPFPDEKPPIIPCVISYNI